MTREILTDTALYFQCYMLAAILWELKDIALLLAGGTP